MKVTGSLRLKHGIWQMVFEYQDSLGQRRQKSESTNLPEKGNKRRAQQMLEKRLDDLEQEYTASLEAKNVLFLTFMKTWLDEVMAYKVKENTLSQYQYVYNNYIAAYKPFHGVHLQAVSPALLQSYYNAQLKNGLSPNTVRKHHANLHKCSNYAVRLRILSSNPAAMVELPPKRKYRGATAYTPEQLQLLLQLFEGDELEPLIRLTVAYGFRRSEVCGLRWSEVDFQRNSIHICHTAVLCNGKVLYTDSTKSVTSNRVLPLTPSMRSYLLELKKQQADNESLLGDRYTKSGYVCVKRSGEPFSPDFISHHFRRRLEHSDLPLIRFHDLRHSAVYALRKGGCDAKDIQCWLGHSDVSTTLNIYGHLLGNDMVRLGEVMEHTLFQSP